MADFNALEALINAYIKQNGVKAITGQVLNGVLRGMVSALGKGWTIADGDATPTTDPGTMTGPVAYIAHTAGTYEHFGNLVVNEGEVALLKYNEQTWTKEVIASLAANASIDSNVGTPAVDVTFQNGVLSFDFRNMKGETGDAAGFGTIGATVDANIGTPSVSVQASGPDTAKNMTFVFRNLKGETGVTSVVATVDNTVGTPACAVSLVGQELHLDFTGLKGQQGDTGSSVDYPFTIVNNLTTNDATQALSAAMGVQLEGEISQLEAEATALKQGLAVVPGSTFNDNNGNITASGNYSRTDKIPFIPNAETNLMDGPAINEVLYWSNGTYLGYSIGEYTETPTVWKVADHTLPVTEVAFTWYLYIPAGELYYIDKTAIISRKEYNNNVGEVGIIPNSTYNDDNGNPTYASGRSRTKKIKYINGAYTNVTTAGVSYEALFWNNNTYLGYSSSNIDAPTTWVVADHTLPVTHIAFCWMSIVSDVVYYRELDALTKQKIEESIAVSSNEVKTLDLSREVINNSAWNDSTGTVTALSGYYRTNKIPAISGAKTNAMELGDNSREVLYWSGNVYLGYTLGGQYTDAPTTWVAEDHTLPVTQIAFCWRSNTAITGLLYYSPNIPFVSRSEMEQSIGSATQGLASETYVDDEVQGLASETYVDDEIAGLKGYTDNAIEDINGSLDGIGTSLATINEALSDLTGELPSGAITGDNVWTGRNVFAQPARGVAGSTTDSFVILSQLHNAEVSHRFANALDYGFSPDNSAADNTNALNGALQNGGKTIVVSRPGTYKVNDTILLYDDTAIIFGEGVIIQKDANYQNMFRNVGAVSRTYNKNIYLIGLTISINGKTLTNNVDSALFGLRGEISFLCSENVNIIDFTCKDLGTDAYCIQLNQSKNFRIENFLIEGGKDGIHISSVDSFVIKNGRIKTSNDDAMALNACDWVSSNCVDGDITNGIIENITDEYVSNAGGFLCRLLGGAWVDWYYGMEIHRGDTVVNNGRIYRAYTPSPTSELFTSTVEPIIDTFTGKQQDGNFYWKLMRDDSVYYSANVRNVEFRKIVALSTRNGFCEEVDTASSTYNRSLYPDVTYENYPRIEITIKGYVFEASNKLAFMSSENCHSYYIVEGVKGHGAALYMNGPIDASIKKRMDATHIDFREYSGSLAMIRSEANALIRVSDCYADSSIGCISPGRVISNCDINNLPYSPIKGDFVIHNQTPKIYNGSSWVSLI